jgi:hypothetical protein
MGSKLPSAQELAIHDPSVSGTIATISPGAFSSVKDQGEIGQALSGAAKRISDQAIKFQNDMNDTSIQDAINQYNKERSALELRRMNIKGKNAGNKQFVDDSTVELDGISSRIRSGLKNSAQFGKWDHLYGQDKVKFGAGMAKYSLQQHDVWDKEVTLTTIAGDDSKANTHYDNTAEIDGTVENSTDRIRKYYTKQGEDEATINLRIEGMKANRYVGAINAAIVNDDKNSPEYLNSASALVKMYGGSIPEAELDKFNKIITTEREVKKVSDDARDFMDQYPDATQSEITAYARGLYPEREDLEKAVKIDMKAIKVGRDKDAIAVRKDQNDSVASTFVDGTVTRESILQTVSDDQDQLKWIGRYNTKRTNSDYAEDDAVRAKLRTMANTDAANLSNDDIWSVVYAKKGITDATAQAIMIRRDAQLAEDNKPGGKGKSKTLKAAHDLIDDYKRVGHPLHKDVEMNETEWALFHRGLDDAFEEAQANKEVFDAIKWAEEQYIVPAKDGWVKKFLVSLATEPGKNILGSEGKSLVTGAMGYAFGDITNEVAADYLRSRGKVVNEKNISLTQNYLESR